MPVVESSIIGIEQTVRRPIIYNVVDQLSKTTKLSIDVKNLFGGDSNKVPQPGSTIDSINPESLLGSNRILSVTVEEDYDESVAYSTAINIPEHIPFFIDNNLRVNLKPIYVTNNVLINFIYKTPSRDEALRWYNEYRMRLSKYGDINTHELEYYYAIPYPYIKLLQTIFALRENVNGLGGEFVDYLINNSSNKLTKISDLSGELQQFVVKEKQVRIFGIYDFDVYPPKPEKDDDSSTYSIKFGYKFNYQLPIGISASYPLMIHNQLLPMEYIPDINKIKDYSDYSNLSFSNSFAALHNLENEVILRKIMNVNDDKYIPIPEFDDFILSNAYPDTHSIIIALCELDLNDKKNLLNLNELGDVVLDQDIINFIQTSEYPYITKLYQSIIQINLYKWNNLDETVKLTCDSNLNIRTDKDLDPTAMYRIRLSLVTNLNLLSKDALWRLRNYTGPLDLLIPNIGLYLTIIDPILNNTGIDNFLNNTAHNPLIIDKILKRIPTIDIGLFNNLPNMRTVEISKLIALKY